MLAYTQKIQARFLAQKILMQDTGNKRRVRAHIYICNRARLAQNSRGEPRECRRHGRIFGIYRLSSFAISLYACTQIADLCSKNPCVEVAGEFETEIFAPRQGASSDGVLLYSEREQLSIGRKYRFKPTSAWLSSAISYCEIYTSEVRLRVYHAPTRTDA